MALLSYFLAVIITIAGNTIVANFPIEPMFSVLFAVPSWSLIFVVIAKGFNRWGWKSGVIRKLGLVEVPDISGRWEGWVTETRSDLPSQYDSEKIEAEIIIQQTWRKIAIEFETHNSDSKSIGATILTKQRVQPTIIYQYKNDPKHSASKNLDIHYGTSNMTLTEEKVIKKEIKVLTGFHYTGPQRETNGELHFKRVED
jgi:hypothetical protein